MVSRIDNCFLSNQHVPLSESEAYKFCECEGRACDEKNNSKRQKNARPEQRRAKFCHKTKDELSGIVARKKQLVSRDTDGEAGEKILRRYRSSG